MSASDVDAPGDGLWQFCRLTCKEVSASEAPMHDATDGDDLLVAGHSKVWHKGSALCHIITVGGSASGKFDVEFRERGVAHMDKPLLEFQRSPDVDYWSVWVIEKLAKVKVNGEEVQRVPGRKHITSGDEITVLNTTFVFHSRQAGDPDFPAVPGTQTNKRKREPDSGECVVCMEMPATHAFVPCGHQCVCRWCASGMNSSTDPFKCPVCRNTPLMFIRIFSNGGSDEAGGSAGGPAGGSAARD